MLNMARTTKKVTRRKNGEGSVYPLKDGRFGAAVSFGTGKDGKRVRKVITGKTEEDVKAQMKELLEKNNLMATTVNKGNSINGNTLVEDFVKEFVKNNLAVNPRASSRTLENYKYCLKHFEKYFEGKSIGSIDTSDLMSFFKNMGEQYSKTLLNRTYQLVAQMYKRAKSLKFIGENPLENYDFQKPVSKKEEHEVTALTNEEISAIQKIVKDNEIIYPVFELMFHTGARTQEALGLRWKDIDIENNYIHIRHAITVDITYDNEGKKHRETKLSSTKRGCGNRDIRIPKDYMQSLILWKEKAPQISKTCIGDEDYVFGNTKNKNWTYSGFRATVNKFIAGHSNEYSKLCLHRIRHTVATMLAEGGASLVELMKLLVHLQPQTTMRYINKASNKIADTNCQRLDQCLFERGL